MKLPVIIANPQVPGTTALPRVAPEDMARGYQTAASGALRFADAAFDWAEREQQLRDAADVADRIGRATQKLDEKSVELDADPDYRTKTERFRKHAGEVHTELTKGLSGRAGVIFKQRYEHVASSMEMRVRHQARKDEIDESKVTLQASIDRLVTLAGSARTDAERQAYLDQAQGLADDAQKAGILTPAQHKIVSRDTLSRYSEAVVQGQIRNNPGVVLKQLGDPNFMPHLDPIRREALKNAAQSRLEHLGALGRAELRGEAADILQSYNQGVRPEDADKRIAAVKRADPKLGERLERAQRAFDESERIERLPIGEQRSALEKLADKERKEGLSAEERAVMRAADLSYRRQVAEIAADAWSASVRRSDTVRELAKLGEDDPNRAAAARDASLEWQQQQGVPPSMQAVISDGTAKAMVAELAGLDGPARAERLRALQAAYGRHWTIVKRQLIDAKANEKVPGLDIMLELPSTPKGMAAAANVADAAKIRDDDLGKLVDPAKVREIRAAAVTELADFTRSIASAPGGAQKAADYNAMVVKRAVQIMAAEGTGASDAVKRAAAELVNDHYTILNDRGSNHIRVPNTINGAAVDRRVVEQNMDAVREALPTMQLQVPPDLAPGQTAEKSAEAFARRLQSNARWQTMQGGESMVLMYEANGRLQPVLTRDGKPLTLRFDAPAMPQRVPGPRRNDPLMGSP